MNTFNLDHLPKYKELIKQHLSTDHLIDGQKGVAEFTYNYLIQKDEDGNLNYFCTDPSRNIFKYIKENGDVGKDIEAEHLTKLLVSAELKKQSLEKAEKISNENE